MKILHTADIHLGSPLSRVQDPQKRRRELLGALDNLSEYANNNDVSAIIVAGDLFDDQYADDKTIQGVCDIVRQSKAVWYVLRGNHASVGNDSLSPYAKLNAICPQIKTFGNQWTNYQVGNVNICGRELGANDQAFWQELNLPSNCYNVLVLHGDVEDDSYGFIDKQAIAKSGAQYVALGHRHTYSAHRFGKTLACYCGVLETRGFDEMGQTGFILLDTDQNKVTFVPQATRIVESVTVDVSSAQSDVALEKIISQAVAPLSSRNYLNLVLTGTLCADLNVKLATDGLFAKFFALRVENKTQPQYDLQSLSQEISLRGEFVRQVLQLPKDEQAEVLQLGLTLLNGGELQ